MVLACLLVALPKIEAASSVPELTHVVEVTRAKIRDHYKGNYADLTTNSLARLAFKPSRNGDAPGQEIMIRGLIASLSAAPVDRGNRFALVFRGLSSVEGNLLAEVLIQKNMEIELDGVPVSSDFSLRCRDRRGVFRAISD